MKKQKFNLVKYALEALMYDADPTGNWMRYHQQLYEFYDSQEYVEKHTDEILIELNQPKQSMSRAVKEKFSEIEKDVEFLKEVAYKGIENGGKLGIVMGYLFDKNRDLFFDLTAMIAERYPQEN